MAVLKGFEPSTSAVTGQHSLQTELQDHVSTVSHSSFRTYYVTLTTNYSLVGPSAAEPEASWVIGRYFNR